ncbi:hypothetical protein [Nostoc sp.]
MQRSLSQVEVWGTPLPFADEFKIVLADNGSLVLDLGRAYLLGNPVRSIY